MSTSPSGPVPAALPRALLVKRLQEDLIGPSDELEVFAERPTERYLTAILFPKGAELPPEDDESLGATSDADDEVSDDAPPPLAGALRPSSCGISFATTLADELKVKVIIACARYRLFFVDPETKEPSELAAHRKRRNERWQRVPLFVELELTLKGADSSQSMPLAAEGIGGLDLFVRTAVAGSSLLVTAVLVNLQFDNNEGKLEAEKRTFFQVRLEARPVAPASLTARPPRTVAQDKDGHIAALIYREAQEFGVGHTCSAAWGPTLQQPEWVSTDFLPTATVRRMKAEGDVELEALRNHPTLKPLDARWLSAEATDAQLVAALRLACEAYGAWLTRQDARISALPAHLQGQAGENLRDCRAAQKRMEASANLVEQNATVRAAWRLAQGAMRIQFEWVKKRGLLWHPFQLAFQLLVVSSLVDRDHPDREQMDLLWFPTGGGKTEAYLALTAFQLFYRRLNDGNAAGSGTAVLMRYTLRLLTIQQFQRAAALICACEAIRRGHEQLPTVSAPALGATPFSIGLWVGGNATPNRYEDARRSLATPGSASSPRQLERCPRCEGRLTWAANSGRKAIEVRCENPSCYLASGPAPLPLWTVDDDLYREVPSLIIATVDKFTQVVRSPSSGVFFGLGNGHLPPDLVIQDELHLISGPLGSLAGLYETAIDRLCSRPQGTGLRRPKVIGSTATIRRAEEQVRQLFDRTAFQFPPPAIDASNSGFGIEDNSDQGRLYVGLTTAGRSAKFALQATYASLLQGATDPRIPSRPPPDNPRDAHWTLTGYFNSLRELGGAVTLVMDDVLKSLQAYARRHADGAARPIAPPVELTSRVRSSEIPRTLETLEVGEGHPGAVDVLLASNMISVGVDIRRLGLMVVAAQPKTIAEYIQATSRVGRHYPGLVVVVYNHPRVRDRSHFETFPSWHGALYRSVEATSVTPFASRARDKALHAVVVALARHLVPTLNNPTPISDAARAGLAALLQQALVRIARIDSTESAGAEREIRAFVDDWQRRSANGALAAYWDEDQHLTSLLLGAELAAALDEEGTPFTAMPTPNSMREVEASSLFRLQFPPSNAQSRRRRNPDAAE